MKKYEFFREYNNVVRYGEDFTDAIRRASTLREMDTIQDGQLVRGSHLSGLTVLQEVNVENHRRGGASFKRFIVEDNTNAIHEIDVIQTEV